MLNLHKQNKKLLSTIRALIKKRGVVTKIFPSFKQVGTATDSDLFLKMNYYEDVGLTAKDNTISPTTKVSDKPINTYVMFVSENTSSEDFHSEADTNFNTNPNPYCFILHDNSKIEVGSVLTLYHGVSYEVVKKIKFAGLTDIVKFKLSIK